MRIKQTIQFAMFGTVMALLHLSQCLFRIKSHEAFVKLASSAAPSVTDSQLWVQLLNYAKYTEIIYYTVSIIFVTIVSYRLIYNKIRFRFTMAAISVIYFVAAFIGIVLRSQNSGINNLLLPVIISYFFALLLIISAGLKRNRTQKAEGIKK